MASQPFPRRSVNSPRTTLVLFTITGFVESLAFGHLGVFTPLFLQQLRVPQSSIGYWTGLLSALGFVIGIPLLPFWAVWAHRFGRKPLIIRSSVVEAILFTIAAFSQNVYMLAVARFLVGFVLGNTGIMMSVQADITPKERIGTALSIVSSGSPVGMAAGPYLGGLLVSRIGIRNLLLIDSGLTMLVVFMLLIFLKEEPIQIESDADDKLPGVIELLGDVVRIPIVALLFGCTFIMVLGINIAQPFLPILVQQLHHGAGLPVAIGAVSTGSGLAMAIATPWWGWIGDRIGHARSLRGCGSMVGLALISQATATSVLAVGLWRVTQGLFQSGIGTLVAVLLATASPSDRRVSVLTLSLLPQQIAWFFGPLIGAAIVQGSLKAVFLAAGFTVAAGSLMTLFVHLTMKPSHLAASE
ncbi:MAG: MFS transporter [Armatimonadetes bacterium]|nr:MFS transporter [Armatimonadota bacterium]